MLQKAQETVLELINSHPDKGIDIITMTANQRDPYRNNLDNQTKNTNVSYETYNPRVQSSPISKITTNVANYSPIDNPKPDYPPTNTKINPFAPNADTTINRIENNNNKEYNNYTKVLLEKQKALESTFHTNQEQIQSHFTAVEPQNETTGGGLRNMFAQPQQVNMAEAKPRRVVVNSKTTVPTKKVNSEIEIEMY